MNAAYSQIASQPFTPIFLPRSARKPGASTSAAAPLRMHSSQKVEQSTPRISSPALLQSSAAAKTCAAPASLFFSMILPPSILPQHTKVQTLPGPTPHFLK